MVSAIEQGYPQREIQQSAYAYQLEIEQKKRVIVGLNAYASSQEAAVPVFRVDPAIEDAQRERVRAVRAARDAGAWSAAMGRIEEAAKGTENLLPLILDAVKAKATVGEISNVLRRVYGEHQETLTL